MNAERRKLLAEVDNLVSQALDLLRQAAEEEQEYFYNMPESFQNGDRGQQAQEVADALSSAADDLENVQSTVQEHCS